MQHGLTKKKNIMDAKNKWNEISYYKMNGSGNELTVNLYDHGLPMSSNQISFKQII